MQNVIAEDVATRIASRIQRRRMRLPQRRTGSSDTHELPLRNPHNANELRGVL